MSKLRHRNILKVLGCYRSQEVVALIAEYMPKASLHDHLYPSSDDKHPPCELNWEKRLDIAVGVAHGLVYLHNQFHEPIIHRDLKPSNILLDEALEVNLGDFGISRFVNPDRDGEKSASALCGTVGYIPPGNIFLVSCIVNHEFATQSCCLEMV
jgi:serine/threonine protein kinase